VVLITDARTPQADLSRGVAALTRACDDIRVIDTEDGFVRLGRRDTSPPCSTHGTYD
jgi:hypothetical protein